MNQVLRTLNKGEVMVPLQRKIDSAELWDKQFRNSVYFSYNAYIIIREMMGTLK